MYIESLALLNQYLKVYNPSMTVVAFIITSAPTRNFNIESLNGQGINRFEKFISMVYLFILFL